MNPIDFMHGLQAGDWPTWLSFATSTGALVAAVIAAKFTGDTLRIERTRDDRLEHQRRSAQAAQVVALPARIPGPEDRTHPDRVYAELPAVLIRNASNLPIWDVMIEWPPETVGQGKQATPAQPHRGLGPGLGSLHAGRLMVPPGDDVIVPLSYTAVAIAFTQNTGEIIDLEALDFDELEALARRWSEEGRPAIAFTDAAQNRWQRDQYGGLQTEKPLAHLASLRHAAHVLKQHKTAQ